jgi:hypothetical protein
MTEKVRIGVMGAVVLFGVFDRRGSVRLRDQYVGSQYEF